MALANQEYLPSFQKRLWSTEYSIQNAVPQSAPCHVVYQMSDS